MQAWTLCCSIRTRNSLSVTSLAVSNFEINRRAIVDPFEKLPSLPVAMRPSDIDERVKCEIFRWVRDEPTRVALTAFDFSAPRGEHGLVRWLEIMEELRSAAA